MQPKVKQEIIATLLRQGKQELVKEVMGAIPASADQFIARVNRLLDSAEESVKQARSSLEKILSNPQKYKPQFHNLQSSFYQIGQAGKIGQRSVAELEHAVLTASAAAPQAKPMVKSPGKDIAIKMQEWHSAMGDPIYQASSTWHAGKDVPYDIANAARNALARMIPDAKKGLYGWGPAEAKDLDRMVKAIDKVLKKAA